MLVVQDKTLDMENPSLVAEEEINKKSYVGVRQKNRFFSISGWVFE